MGSRYRLTQWIIAAIFVVIGAACLLIGILIGHARLSSLLLMAFGVASLVFAATFAAITLLVRRRVGVTLEPAERAGVLEYLRISRLIRAGVELVLGTGIVIFGIVIIVGGATLGFVVAGPGVVLLLLGVLNIWLVRRITSAAASVASAPVGDAK